MSPGVPPRPYLALALTLATGAAVLMSPASASAFCRTTTTPVPASYSPRSGCFTDGLLLYWKNACVSYSLNASATSKIAYETAASVIDGSFATWSSATCPSGTTLGLVFSSRSPVQADEVRYNPEGPNQNLIVFRETSWPYNDPNNTLGLTTVTFDATTGEIFDADMEINATGKNLTATDPVPATGYDLQSVVTHEVGHFLGLAHATDSRATMYASYKPGSTALRTLTADDVAGGCAIYPSDDVRIVDATVAKNATGSIAADACNDEPRHGFGTGNTGASSSNGGSSSCGVTPAPVSGPGPSPGALAVVAAVAGVAIGSRRRRVR